MALGKETKSLIEAVAKNDIRSARKIAEALVNAETAKSNQAYVNWIKKLLKTSGPGLLEVPGNLKGMLVMEDVSNFNEGRYYLSSREKAILDELICMYEVGMKLNELGIRYLNSMLMFGESGTGKTTFGRYIAYRLGLPFAYVSFANVIDSLMGATAKNISKIFEYIETTKCVLMLDEVDTIGAARGTDSLGEVGRITINLMQCLDGVKNDTVILAATNRKDSLDDALLRRFTIQHEVKKLDKNELFKMMTMFLNDTGFKYCVENIKDYCENGVPQAIALNDLIRAIAKSVKKNDLLVTV